MKRSAHLHTNRERVELTTTQNKLPWQKNERPLKSERPQRRRLERALADASRFAPTARSFETPRKRGFFMRSIGA